MDSPTHDSGIEQNRAPVTDEVPAAREVSELSPAADFVDERPVVPATDPEPQVVESEVVTPFVPPRPGLAGLGFSFMGWSSYQAELQENYQPELPLPPESNFKYRDDVDLYTHKEMAKLSARIADGISACSSFEELRDLLGEDLSLTTLSKTLRSASNDKELLEQAYNLEPMGDLVIRAEGDIYSQQQMDSFFARTIASGHRLTVNLVLAELYFLADSLEGVSADCKDACKQTIEEAMDYMKWDTRFDPESAKFVDHNGKPIAARSEDHTLLQHFRREVKEIRGIEQLTLFTRNETKLLATFRAFASEVKQIKDDLGVLLAAIYVEEEEGLVNPLDQAIGEIAGVESHVTRANPGRFKARYNLTPKIEQAIQDLTPGYEQLRESLGADRSVILDRIIPAMERSWFQNLKQAYVGFKNTKAGKIASIASLANAGVAICGLAAAQWAGVDGVLHQLPVVGAVTGVIAHPAYRIASFVLFAGLLDKTQDWVRARDLKKLIGRVEPNDLAKQTIH